MARTIKFSSEAMESIIRSLASAGANLEGASSTLSGIHLSSGNGANLRPGGISITVGNALQGYKRALDCHASSLMALSKKTARAKAMFEDGEKRNILFAPDSKSLDDTPNAFAGLRGMTPTTVFGRAIGEYGKDKTGQFHKDISLAMLEMSDIAYNDQETGWYDKQKLAQLGFVNSTYLDPPGAIIAWRLNEAGEPLVAIAFRGTSKAADIAVDSLVADNESGVHSGFDFYADLFAGQLSSVTLKGIDGSPTVKELIFQTQEGGKANFLLTGHSLGGAEAQIMAYRLLQSNLPNDSVSAYTFASPQPFTRSGIDAALGDGAHVYNVINNIDVVTHLGAVNDELPPGFSLLDNRNIGMDIRTIPTVGEIAGNILDSAKEAVETVFTPPIVSPLINTWNMVNGNPTAGEIAENILDSTKEVIFTSPIASPFVGAFNIVNGNHSLDTYRKIVGRM